MTSEQIEEGRRLREAGASFPEISRQLSVPASTVRRKLKPFEPVGDPYECGPSAVADLDPGDVAAEVRLMRSLAKKAKDEGAPALVLAQLAKCINDLSKNYVASNVRAGRMLHIDTATEFIRQMGAMFVAEFIHACPDAHDRVDRIVANMRGPANDKKQTHELIGRER